MTTQLTQKDAQLKEVLDRKLQSKIAEGNRASKPMLDQIDKEGNALEDFIVPLGKDGVVSFKNGDGVKMLLPIGKKSYSLHPHAAAQTADRLGIPSGYLKNLVGGQEEWKHRLAVQTLNDHTQNTSRERLLVRSIGTEVRGVLSDHYRRLSTPQIYNSYISEVKAQGGQIISAFADDTRSFLEVLLGHTVPVPTKNNGVVFIAFGSRISSSDFGDGALDVRSFIYQAVCTNGLVTESLMRQIHLGGRLPGDLNYSNKTYQLDTETQASMVSDLVKQIFSKEEITKRARQIQGASEVEVDMDNELKRLPRLGVQKQEVEQVKNTLLQNNKEDGISGKSTLWKLTQAVSATARSLEGRRKRELDEIAGNLMLSVK